MRFIRWEIGILIFRINPTERRRGVHGTFLIKVVRIGADVSDCQDQKYISREAETNLPQST